VIDVAAWVRRHHLQLLRAIPVVVVGGALFVLLARNADTPAMPDYEVPEGFVPAPPPTTAAPGATRPALVAVGGTTTTPIPPNVGRAHLAGTVNGPQGAVPGAVVRIERVIGGQSQVLDLLTGPDGRYDAPGLGGGRYRVRAFLAPTLAQPTGAVFFLRTDEERVVDLAMEAFGDRPAISFAFAPDPPLLDQAVNVAVRVTGRLVDPDGLVRTQSAGGALVTVSAAGGMQATSSATSTTDGDGQSFHTFRCSSTTPTQLQVTVRLALATPPTVVPVDPTATTATTVTTSTTSSFQTVTDAFEVPACVDPTTLTTTTVPGTDTSAPAGGGSSTSTTSTTVSG